MLVLSRKVDEVICIGDDIEIMVIQVQHDKVRLGVKAPRNVIVDRQEIHLLKQAKAGEQSSSPNLDDCD